MRRRSYLLFALRELSCLFVAWFVVSLLLLFSAINAGEDRYQQFLSVSANPWMLLLNVIALLFVMLHSITWFNQTPQVIVVRMRGQRVHRKWIVTCIYLFWAVLSAVVAWTILRDGLRLKHPNPVINAICYTGAITGSIMAGYILLGT